MLAASLAPFVTKKLLSNSYSYGGGTVSILVSGDETGGAFSLLESVQRPGAEPPVHIHETADELFYILEGNVAVKVGDAVHYLSAGNTIFLPRGIPHTFRIKSPSARALTLITPAGFEEWFRTIGKPATTFDPPCEIFPPTEDEFTRMMELSSKLRVQLVPEPVDI